MKQGIMGHLIPNAGGLGAVLVVAIILAVLTLGVVNGQASTGGIVFENCEKLTNTKNVYWNLDRTAGVVTYAFEDQIPEESWSAFGFNTQNKALMVPSDVVLTTATTAIDYYLSARAQCSAVGGVSSGVCPDTAVSGVNNVRLISALRVNGITKVTFSKPLKTGDADDLDLSTSVDQSLQAIFGSGPLDSSGQPNYHASFLDGGYVNDFIKITLGRTPNLNCVPLLSDSAVNAGTTANGTASAPSPSPEAVVASIPVLPSGTPGCSITFGGRSLSFQVCRQEAAGITYRWNNLGAGQLEVAISCDHDGWCGLGIGPKMVGSSAIVAFPGDSSGTYISNYLLGGQSEKAVVPRSGTLRVGPLAAEYVDGVLTMLFNLTLPPAQYPVSKIIVGKGSKGNPGDGRINEHDTYFQGQINWAQGTVKLDLYRGLTRAHGILQVVVWVFFFPAGVLSARYLKHRDPLWWHLHRGFQSLGFLLFLIAMGLSLKAKALNGTYSTAHKALGVFLLVAVALQVLAVVLRPKKTAKIRFAWNQYHHWLGRLALLLSIVTIYLGLHLFVAGSAVLAAYSVLWILVALVFVGMELWWRLRGPWSRRYKEPNVLPQARPGLHNLNGQGGRPAAFSVENGYE